MYCSINSNEHDYTFNSRCPDNCYVKNNNLGFNQIGYFQDMTFDKDKFHIEGSQELQAFDQLHIEHFAVAGSQKGKKKGEPLLRGFAALLAEQVPSVTYMTFSLCKATSNSDIEKLANARESLFDRINATDIIKEPIAGNPNIIVHAKWAKDKW